MWLWDRLFFEYFCYPLVVSCHDHVILSSTSDEVDQIYLENSEMFCWTRIENSWTDRVRNEELLRREQEERNILHTATEAMYI
jgi:hypothetical protein